MLISTELSGTATVAPRMRLTRSNSMLGKLSLDRRRFVSAAGTAIAAAQLGVFGCTRSDGTAESAAKGYE